MVTAFRHRPRRVVAGLAVAPRKGLRSWLFSAGAWSTTARRRPRGRGSGGAGARRAERLSWPRTVGLGAQHVVAMFGATFVFPIVMGLNPQLAILMSGVATICFLLIVQNKVPSYLGTSSSCGGALVAIRAQGGDSPDVTGAILVAGVVLAACGLIIHSLGSRGVYPGPPPVVPGAR